MSPFRNGTVGWSSPTALGPPTVLRKTLAKAT